MRRIRSRVGAVLATIALLVAGVSVLATGAGASVQPGLLLVKGPGSTYAGPGSTVSLWTTPGATVAFGFQVRNISPQTAQFNIRAYLNTETCPPTGGCPPFPTPTVTAGSLIVSPLTSGPYGYWTAPIAPGKSLSYTFKYVLPKTLAPTDSITGTIQLYDIQNQVLSSVNVQGGVTATAGHKYADDEFITPAGGKSVGFWDDFTPQTLPSYVTAPSIALTKSAKYTVKIINDSTTAASVNFRLSDVSGCAAHFPVKVLAGTTDITSAVLSGFYSTAPLAPKKYVLLTVQVTYLSSGCSVPSDQWAAITSGGGGPTQTLYLVTNPIQS
jgi:hypothetical protein